MIIVADVAEGEEIVRQLRNYDGVYLTNQEFGRLSFKVDFNDLEGVDRANFVKELTDIHPELIVNINDDNSITFDYYVTYNIVTPIRNLVDKYCQPFYGGYLYYLKYDPPYVK